MLSPSLVICLAAASMTLVQGGPADTPLDLDFFEDDDCRETPEAEVLLHMMYDLGDLLDRALFMSSLSHGTGSLEVSEAWSLFYQWQAENLAPMASLAATVLGRPYCEPGKVAWTAAQCLLVLRTGERGADEALQCAESLDEDFLAEMTPRGSNFATRLHLMLRSPWPAFRLLDLLVRLHPENSSTRMGTCRSFLNWQSEPDAFDWSRFKPLLTSVVDYSVAHPELFHLKPEDGPLSRQYKARWHRVHSTLPGMQEAIAFSDDVVEIYKEHHYRAGCHVGVIASYLLQVLLLHWRDVQGRLHRYLASAGQLLNIHAPFPHVAKTDWPVFRLLQFTSFLQRTAPTDALNLEQPKAPNGAAEHFVASVGKALAGLSAATSKVASVFVTGAWGTFGKYVPATLKRWVAVLGRSQEPRKLMFLGFDSQSFSACQTEEKRRGGRSAGRGVLACVDAPTRLGLDFAIAKYLALAEILRSGRALTAWVDFDTFPLRDPTPFFRSEFEGDRQLLFAHHLSSDSVSPAVIVAKPGSDEALELMMLYGSWLRENPYLLDHQGWDQLLDHREGDFAGGFDYQGRNITQANDAGPQLSFMPPKTTTKPQARWKFLGNDVFGSGAGWLGPRDLSGLALFHFWGASQSQGELFELLFSKSAAGTPRGVGEDGPLDDESTALVLSYRRKIASSPSLKAMLGTNFSEGDGGGRPLHLVEVSYAHGCCERSLRKNREQALAVGCDEARSYGRSDLSPAWWEEHRQILSQKKGGGWWLWKPYVILQTLLDPAVPWSRGVVIWVDAGNYLYSDPRPYLTKALRDSDVAALRLKWCLEADWTSATTFNQMNVSESYSITDRPQVGAYFLAFRKTQTSIDFVQQWLRHSEDRLSLLGGVALEADGKAAPEEGPSFQKHQADQSILSILFKQWGFRAQTLEEGHKYVKLARWRE